MDKSRGGTLALIMKKEENHYNFDHEDEHPSARTKAQIKQGTTIEPVNFYAPRTHE